MIKARNDRDTLFLCAEGAGDRFMLPTLKKEYLVLQLNNWKYKKERSEQNVSRKEVTGNTAIESVKQ